MKAVDRLRRDHTILRAKLNVLEGALKMGPEVWFVLREVCYTLARQLRDHIRREEALVAACRHAMREETLTHVTVEHRDEPQRLRLLNRLFMEETGHSLDHLRPVLTDVIDGLRRHMAEEEAELFPVLEQVLSSREAVATRSPQPSPLHVDEVTAVNRILRDYPATKRVFDSLFVNTLYEGCDCLDEVAWRRGMEARDLIDRLEEVIASCACRKPEASKQPASITTPEEAGATT